VLHHFGHVLSPGLRLLKVRRIWFTSMSHEVTGTENYLKWMSTVDLAKICATRGNGRGHNCHTNHLLSATCPICNEYYILIFQSFICNPWC
jgi:hypothetical protein